LELGADDDAIILEDVTPRKPLSVALKSPVSIAGDRVSTFIT